MASPTRIRIVRELPHDAKDAYAWLTDFEPEDALRAGAVIKTREIVERSPTRVVYRGETEALGRRAWAVTEVLLDPPTRWQARVVDGPRTGSWTTYVIEPTPAGCRLTLEYHFVFVDRVRHLLVKVARGLLQRELERMWDGFARSMGEELPRARLLPSNA